MHEMRHPPDRGFCLRKQRIARRGTGEIADRLFLSPETVRWHVKAILRKLKARTRAEAAAVLREVMA